MHTPLPIFLTIVYLNIMFKLELPYQENPAFFSADGIENAYHSLKYLLFTLCFVLFDILKHNSALGVWGLLG